MTDDIHADAAAFAIGALDPAEQAAFERHLAGCADCQREVAEMRAAAAELAAGLDAEPPPGLRDSILTQIASTPQDRPLSDPAPASPQPVPGRHAGPASREPAESEPAVVRPTEVTPTEVTPAEVTPAEVRPAEVRGAGHDAGADAGADVVPIRRSWRTRASALVAAAAVLGAVAVGAWAIQSRNEARDETAAVSEQVETLTTLLAAPDVQTASTNVANGGTATVVRSASENNALLVTADLADLPSDQVYEAWTIDEDPVPAGIFEAGDSPHKLPDDAVFTSTVAVTIEPAGGSETPTTNPVAVIELS